MPTSSKLTLSVNSAKFIFLIFPAVFLTLRKQLAPVKIAVDLRGNVYKFLRKCTFNAHYITINYFNIRVYYKIRVYYEVRKVKHNDINIQCAII